VASASGDHQLVSALVDANGLLIEADGPLLRLQREAGANLGEQIALPQLAAIARLVVRLGIPVSRAAVVAANDSDLDLWVHARPVDGNVRIDIEKWLERPPSRPRLEQLLRHDHLALVEKNEWSCDPELRFREIGSDFARILGASETEIIGQPLTKWLRFAEEDDGSIPLIVAVASRKELSMQHAFSRRGGANRLVISGQPAFGSREEYLGFRGSARIDNESRPLAANEEGMTGIDPALDDALRSPIDRIIKAAEGIADRSDGPLRSDYAGYAADIAAAARHLTSVIRSMVEPSVEPTAAFDGVALADEAIALVEQQATAKSVRLVLSRSDQIDVLGDDRSIIQILVNLLGNAVRHAPQGSEVTVSISAGTEFVSWTVSDHGKGIDLKDQERIFGRFERGSENGGSSGLGLAIARRLARSMGGDITLVSAPEQGARFTLSLPLAP
jgi:signal transduction histidine kinase